MKNSPKITIKYFLLIITFLLNFAFINCTDDLTIEESEKLDLVDMGSYYLIEGDMAFNKDDYYHRQVLDQLLEKTEQEDTDPLAGPRRSISKINGAWPNNKMLYYLDESIMEFTEYEKENIAKAMKELESYAGIRFIEKSKPGDYVYRIYKTDEQGICGSSTVGYSEDSWYKLKCNSVGVIQHEIMHGLGFRHEQVREDRDKFIKVNYENIIEDKEHNFDIDTDTEIHSAYYDYDSVMHYGPWAFDNNGEKTIETKTEAYEELIGQRYNLSYIDILGLIKLYGAPQQPLIVLKHDLPSFSPYAFLWKNSYDKMEVPVEVDPSGAGESSKVVTLTIENWGKSTLNIFDAKIISSNSEWTVVEQPENTSLEQGESTTFKVKLTLGSNVYDGEIFDADVQITSNSAIDLSNSDSKDLLFYLRGRAIKKEISDETMVTASSYRRIYSPEKTLDGKLSNNSRWASKGVDEWIKYDLGKQEEIGSVDIAFMQEDNKKYVFSIDLSSDNNIWETVFDGMSSAEKTGFQTFIFPNQNARYVRINAYGNTIDDWNLYTEVKINIKNVNTTENLVKNGSFELGRSTPRYWETPGKNVMLASTRTPHGEKALQLSGKGRILSTSQTIEIEQDTNYKVSVWVKVTNGTEGIVLFDTGGLFDETCQFEIEGSTNGRWKKFTGTFDSKDHTSVTLRMLAKPQFNGTAYFDNVSLTEID